MEAYMKSLITSLVLATSLVGVNSYAGDREFARTVTGGALGAIVGNHVGGTNGAIVGGVAGAYIGNRVTRDEPRREVVYVRESRPIYYEAPAPVYYGPPPGYYAPRPVYEREWRHHGRHHGHHRGHGHGYGHY